MTIDLHTHSIASGHGGRAMIHQMAKTAADRKLSILGITDHGPATPGSARESYFRSLIYSGRYRYGVRLLLGCELNILDFEGHLDLPDELIGRLDFNIASLHPQNIVPGSCEENTHAYIRAMAHPAVDLIGHPDDTKYAVDYDKLVYHAVQTQTLLELNNASLMSDGYRGNTRTNDQELLKYCRHYHHPILIGSDSHGLDQIARHTEALELIHDAGFPESLVLNHHPMRLLEFLHQKL